MKNVRSASVRECALHSSAKSTTSQNFQTVILVLFFCSFGKFVYKQIACCFYIVLLVLSWPDDLSLTVRTQTERSFLTK